MILASIPSSIFFFSLISVIEPLMLTLDKAIEFNFKPAEHANREIVQEALCSGIDNKYLLLYRERLVLTLL